MRLSRDESGERKGKECLVGGEARRSRGLMAAEVHSEPTLEACSAHARGGVYGERFIRAGKTDLSAAILIYRCLSGVSIGLLLV